MYIPNIYKNENPEEIKTFLEANAFGILITAQNHQTLATHIPLEFIQKDDGTALLHAHISKANAQCDHLMDGAEALCIFNGPHSYISSSWYDFEEVPTWNYIAVHVRGKIRVLDKQELWESLKLLTDKYEASQENPVQLETLSDKTMRQINGIIGFEMAITSIEAAYKLSQSRDDKNHEVIVDHLTKSDDSGSQAIGKKMKKMRN